MTLTADERARYARHLSVPEIGESGQARLKNSRALVIGAGGLGSPVLQYLAAAGVGTLGIIDDDTVDISNLQRQIIHGPATVGSPKVDSARTAITAINPLVTVETHHERLTASNALGHFENYDLIIDGSDNFATRYLISDAATILRKPCVWGSVLRFEGQVSVFWAGRGPTYRDLYPEPGATPSCGEAGVLGAVCGLVGTLMASEAIKILTGVGEPLLGRVAIVDALVARWREFGFAADPAAPGITSLEQHSAAECDSRQGALPTLTWGNFMTRGADALLCDVREADEHANGHVAGSLHIPSGQLLAGEWELLPRDRDVVFYCASGQRSGRVVAAALAAGFTRVSHLDGGYNARP